MGTRTSQVLPPFSVSPSLSLQGQRPQGPTGLVISPSTPRSTVMSPKPRVVHTSEWRGLPSSCLQVDLCRLLEKPSAHISSVLLRALDVSDRERLFFSPDLPHPPASPTQVNVISEIQGLGQREPGLPGRPSTTPSSILSPLPSKGHQGPTACHHLLATNLDQATTISHLDHHPSLLNNFCFHSCPPQPFLHIQHEPDGITSARTPPAASWVIQVTL